MKSTLVNMVAVLFTITLVASAGVGYVNMITVGPIAEAKAAATQSALRAVLPPFDRTETTELTLGRTARLRCIRHVRARRSWVMPWRRRARTVSAA